MDVKVIVAKLKNLPDFSIQRGSSWMDMRVVSREDILSLIKELEDDGLRVSRNGL